jgi:hypothetical protein
VTAAFLTWLLGWVKATPAHFLAFGVTTLAAYICLLLVLGYLAWHLAPARFRAAVTRRLERLRWSRQTRARVHPRLWIAPPRDDVVEGCWLDVAEDEPLPIALDGEQAVPVREVFGPLMLAGPIPHRQPKPIPAEVLPEGRIARTNDEIDQAVTELIVWSHLEYRAWRGGLG